MCYTHKIKLKIYRFETSINDLHIHIQSYHNNYSYGKNPVNCMKFDKIRGRSCFIEIYTEKKTLRYKSDVSNVFRGKKVKLMKYFEIETLIKYWRTFANLNQLIYKFFCFCFKLLNRENLSKTEHFWFLIEMPSRRNTPTKASIKLQLYVGCRMMVEMHENFI